MSQKVVGILRGGGRDYERSLQHGGALIACINDKLSGAWQCVDILVGRDGVWHWKGVPIRPSDLGPRVDAAWDATFSNLDPVLDSVGIPHVRNGAFAHALSGDRDALERHVRQAGIQMPRSILLSPYQADIDGSAEQYAAKRTRQVFEKFGAPWMLYTLEDRHDMATRVAKTLPELMAAIQDGARRGANMLVEELIPGRPVSVHSVPGFRGEKMYHFFPAEVHGREERERLAKAAQIVYDQSGAGGYLRSDFILTPGKGAVLQGIEPEPDFAEESDFSRALGEVSAQPHHLVSHLLGLAIA